MSEEVEWTTDMRFPVGNGFEMKDVSAHIKSFFETPSHNFGRLHRELCEKFDLTCGDANLAIDRAQGGVVRALTTNIQNKPDPIEDPIANYMFNTVWNSLPTSGFIFKKRHQGGKWLNWYNELQR